VKSKVPHFMGTCIECKQTTDSTEIINDMGILSVGMRWCTKRGTWKGINFLGVYLGNFFFVRVIFRYGKWRNKSERLFLSGCVCGV